MSEFDVSKLVTDYKDMGMIKLAQKHGMTKTAVRKHLLKAGVILRGKGRPKGFVNVAKPTKPIPTEKFFASEPAPTTETTEVDPFVTSTTPPEDFRGLID